jgi:dCMP deaminase
MRPSFDDYFINLAEITATRSTCDRLHVGAIIVKDNRIISQGYNGSIHGHSHCTDKTKSLCEGGCLNDEGRCIKTIHAEVNALLHADREDLKGSTCYTSHAPCENCSKLLAQAGIVRIVYRHAYDNKYNKYFTEGIEVVQHTP